MLFDLFNKTKLFVISVSGFTITCSLSFHFIKPHPPFWCPILLGPFLILCFSIDLPTVNLLSRPNTIYSRYIAQPECSRRTERVLVYSKMNHPTISRTTQRHSYKTIDTLELFNTLYFHYLYVFCPLSIYPLLHFRFVLSCNWHTCLHVNACISFVF